MGAFIFVWLEKENELATREEVGNTRNKTLEQLYGITGKTLFMTSFMEDPQFHCITTTSIAVVSNHLISAATDVAIKASTSPLCSRFMRETEYLLLEIHF
jgi:hypothetical protein